MTQSDNNSMQIGWASRDVTPDKSVNLYGQFYMRISKGVQDPVTITALALSNDGFPCAAVILYRATFAATRYKMRNIRAVKI